MWDIIKFDFYLTLRMLKADSFVIKYHIFWRVTNVGLQFERFCFLTSAV